MVRSRTQHFAFRFLLFAAFPLAGAEKPTVIPLIPSVDWRLVQSQTLGLEAVRQYGGDPAIEREYGVQSLERRTYQQVNTIAEVIVERVSDPTAAYGLLTYYRTGTPEKGLQATLVGPAGALMARGRSFIRVLPLKGSRVSQGEFRALLTRVGGSPPPADALAGLPVTLPKKGLVPGSEKYVLGPEAARRVLPSFRTDLIGFSRGAEVQMGTYANRKGRVGVMAVTYPTPQIARRQFSLMEKLLGVNQSHEAKSLRGRREGSFVFLVLDADSDVAANKVLDEFKVSNSVSWDKPYPGRKPFTVELVELILANIIIVMAVMGSGILGGILIVLFRKAMGRLFPDSGWAHPDEGVIIKLRLG